MQTKNILVTSCAENLENTLCLLPDPLFVSLFSDLSKLKKDKRDSL